MTSATNNLTPQRRNAAHFKQTMSREIKFRAYHQQTKVMYWFDLMWGNHNKGNGYIGMAPWGQPKDKPEGLDSYRGNVSLVDPADCVIMQYTGLKDKNGKEIYEGDVVTLPDTESEFAHNGIANEKIAEADILVIASIIWHGTGWAVSINQGGEIWDKGVTMLSACDYSINGDCAALQAGIEVIGNVHDNPELLSA